MEPVLITAIVLVLLGVLVVLRRVLRGPTLLDRILAVYAEDNASAWDCDADGIYRRRTPEENESPRAAQEIFMDETSPIWKP